METFFMFGKYNLEALREMSVQRTQQIIYEIKELGGKVTSMHVLLGKYDLLFCVNLPGIDAAMKASVNIARVSGICFETYPGITVEAFDQMISA